MDTCVVRVVRSARDEHGMMSLESFDAVCIHTADALHGIGRSPDTLADDVELTQRRARQA